MQANYLLPSCCICDSLFDMQHDHVLKKLNFDLLTPSPYGCRGRGDLWAKKFSTMLLHFVIPFN